MFANCKQIDNNYYYNAVFNATLQHKNWFKKQTKMLREHRSEVHLSKNFFCRMLAVWHYAFSKYNFK